MFEFLPHPDMNATNLSDLVMQTNDYLFRLKETLEFMLLSIDIENLSPEFRAKLDAIGVDIQTSNDIREDGMAQMASRSITVEDVVSSSLLDAKLDKRLKGGTLTNTDLNTVTYNFYGWAKNCTNAPSEEGILESVASGDGSVMQRFTNMTNTTSMRWYNKTWGTWT